MTEKQIRQKVVETALSYLGCKESNGSHKQIIDLYNSHTPRARGYKMTYSDPWCATFVSAIAIKLGYTDIMPTECSCTRMIQLYKNLNCWKETDSYKPEIGDVVMYDWNDSGSGENQGTPEHVGLVSAVNGNDFEVVEGNYDNAVKVRKMKVNGRYIRGFCLPNYASKATPEVITPVAPEKSITVVAKEVIDGKWGNGEARKQKLSAAGYDPKAVQAEVNRILAGGGSSALKPITTVAKEVINGKWGNGEARKKKLAAAGYDPAAVQAEVNRLLR